MIPATQYINQIVNVEIDRPLNSKHPKHGFVYSVNYGRGAGVIVLLVARPSEAGRPSGSRSRPHAVILPMY